MRIETVGAAAVVRGEGILLDSGRSAMELIATVRYETGFNFIILPKEHVSEDFFRLSTHLAGEILQKFMNYQMKLAIVGDFSAYISENLKDFLYESNKGTQVWFLPTVQDVLSRLGESTENLQTDNTQK